MTEIGKLNRLKITRAVDFGIYLDGEELGEILLPRRYIPENCKIGDKIEVFIYLDSEDRIIATTEKPFAMAGQFAFLKVVSVNPVGAFLYWGLPKDLFAPFAEQNEEMLEGKSYIVFIYLDDKKQRLVASSKLYKFLNKLPPDFREGQEVELLVYGSTDIGYKAIINNSHSGILYKNEVFQSLKRGQFIKGFIKKIRDDKKIDLCLHKPGYEKVSGITEKIIGKLKEKGGFIPVTDKTSPEVIYKLFEVSKNTYKKAIGALYKKRIITIEDDGIKLNVKK